MSGRCPSVQRITGRFIVLEMRSGGGMRKGLIPEPMQSGFGGIQSMGVLSTHKERMNGARRGREFLRLRVHPEAERQIDPPESTARRARDGIAKG